MHRVLGMQADAGGPPSTVGRAAAPRRTTVEAVLVDRDGTLIDVPYNGDPDLVQPVAGARRSLDRLRDAGLPVAVSATRAEWRGAC